MAFTRLNNHKPPDLHWCGGMIDGVSARVLVVRAYWFGPVHFKNLLAPLATDAYAGYVNHLPCQAQNPYFCALNK